MNPLDDFRLLQTRRAFLGGCGLQAGGAALAMLMGQASTGHAAATVDRAYPPLPGLPHFPPKAKALIYLHMNGGPSQLDLWDF